MVLEAFRPVESSNTPITEVSHLQGWKEIPIKENGEPLVSIGPFSRHPNIFTSSIYFGERVDSPYLNDPFPGSYLTIFARESVARQLEKAQSLLPKGMFLVVFDAYRSIRVQESLFETYYKKLNDQNPNWTQDQLLAESQKYVSLPSRDPTKPSPHNSGGSVDLSILQIRKPFVVKQVEALTEELLSLVDESLENSRRYELEMRRAFLIANNARLLNFGTAFDYGGAEAALTFFEGQKEHGHLSKQEIEARNNRRILYWSMIEAGFEPYPDEWWHYNSKKSQMGAKVAGLPYAEYGPATLSQQEGDHEIFRRKIRARALRLLGKIDLSRFNKQQKDVVLMIQNLGNYTGDIRASSIEKAARIEPQKV